VECLALGASSPCLVDELHDPLGPNAHMEFKSRSARGATVDSVSPVAVLVARRRGIGRGRAKKLEIAVRHTASGGGGGSGGGGAAGLPIADHQGFASFKRPGSDGRPLRGLRRFMCRSSLEGA